MSMCRVVACDIKGCMKKMLEETYGAGWPGWGSLEGKQDTETGETKYYLCPEHLEATFKHALGLEVT